MKAKLMGLCAVVALSSALLTSCQPHGESGKSNGAAKPAATQAPATPAAPAAPAGGASSTPASGS